jgi:hypothetical protein
VEYEFDRWNQIDSVWVYWWADGAGISQPTEAYVDYWECDTFAKAGDIGILLDQYNTLAVNLKTNRLRIYMISDRATGIIEFQVFGVRDPVIIQPFIQVNNEIPLQTNKASVLIGDSIQLKPEISGSEPGSWEWTGPGGFTSSADEISIDSIIPDHSGVYIASYSIGCGISYKQDFSLTVKSSEYGAFYWPSYSPDLQYKFRDEFPDLQMPTQDLDDCAGVVGSQSSGWWTFRWGPNARSVVTPAAITPMLERMNTDFAYFRDTLGWPPDKRAQNGYRSAIYLYGSGLCTDNADSNALGGWQSSIFHNGESWPMVLISYYPVYSFDPSCPYGDREFQMGAVVHEGIHSILADLPGVKNAAWFHEGGNTWLQQEADSRRSGDYSSMGWLNGCTFIAPFMPVECYSGWLQDDSFGGPSAEGVNRYSGSQQLCTWRNYLGGNQYGNTFPTFLGQALGEGSVAWIWRYCPGRVLEGMADALGDLQMRRLITEYRAKQALVDFGVWTNAIRDLLDGRMNSNIRAEWSPSWLSPDVWKASPYARTTLDSNGVLIPEYRTTPGWSGANQIPLHVKSDSVYLDFRPIGKNMKCLFCYRDINGNPVYSEPVDSGECSFLLPTPPANDVIIAVIVNTDYVYKGEETRKAHFDYRIKIDTALTIPAHTHKRWYAHDDNPSADNPPVLPPITLPDTFPPTGLLLALDTVYENDGIGTVVGIISTVDSNNVNAHTYSLVSGEGDDGNASFRISGNQLLINRQLDYETNPAYSIRIRTTDAHGNHYEKSFEIPIVDIEPETSVREIIAEEINVLFYPNPFDQSATVKLPKQEIIERIEIINLTGTIVKVIDHVNSDECYITRDGLSQGVYYLRINAGNIYFLKAIFQ